MAHTHTTDSASGGSGGGVYATAYTRGDFRRHDAQYHRRLAPSRCYHRLAVQPYRGLLSSRLLGLSLLKQLLLRQLAMLFLAALLYV